LVKIGLYREMKFWSDESMELKPNTRALLYSNRLLLPPSS
jgi:hypothetical protein